MFINEHEICFYPGHGDVTNIHLYLINKSIVKIKSLGEKMLCKEYCKMVIIMRILLYQNIVPEISSQCSIKTRH